MTLGKWKRWALWIVPLCIAVGIYPVSFDGKQLITIDAPLSTTFDVLVKHLWNFHPFIIEIDELNKINETCSFFKITDRLLLLPQLNLNYTSSYYVYLNVDRDRYCVTSRVHTPLNIMTAYHEYCMHVNTLKTTTTIITDQFRGQSWMIFKSYIRMKMFQSHKSTLDRLRKEMMIYATE